MERIDLGIGLPKGFSALLAEFYSVCHVDALCTKNFTDEFYDVFYHDKEYFIDKASFEEPQIRTKRELGRFMVLEALYVPGAYINSCFIVHQEDVDLVTLIYDEGGKLHIWYPWFEELYHPLIHDCIEFNNDSHLEIIKEVYDNLDFELNVGPIIKQHDGDTEICRQTFERDIPFPSFIYHALIKHIMLFEKRKYPLGQGALRPFKAFEDLYESYIKDDVDLEKWRRDYKLDDPWNPRKR
ncbi:hypothetical protein [Neobacillus mesonae]|uniref:hypothetical protein n=1 Tax=Neobacillus mesonae TaxID=1193713 RepID=UPI0025726225|nr:hypothetical protein [Neobacillus mesonae]